MLIVSPLSRIVGPLPNGHSWLINGGMILTTYVRPGMIFSSGMMKSTRILSSTQGKYQVNYSHSTKIAVTFKKGLLYTHIRSMYTVYYIYLFSIKNQLHVVDTCSFHGSYGLVFQRLLCYAASLKKSGQISRIDQNCGHPNTKYPGPCQLMSRQLCLSSVPPKVHSQHMSLAKSVEDKVNIDLNL